MECKLVQRRGSSPDFAHADKFWATAASNVGVRAVGYCKAKRRIVSELQSAICWIAGGIVLTSQRKEEGLEDQTPKLDGHRQHCSAPDINSYDRKLWSGIKLRPCQPTDFIKGLGQHWYRSDILISCRILGQCIANQDSENWWLLGRERACYKLKYHRTKL